jgi:two-component system nitrogen regulation response regulator GlnG
MAKLLVIDDEPNILYTISETLAAPDVEVISAASAHDGIEAVRTRRPDAVLLDVRLPDMSGLEAFRRIREIDPQLPVVIMTAFTTTETAIEAIKAGAFEYLVKPVDYARVQDVVDRAFDVSRMNRVPALLPTEAADAADSDRIIGNSAVMQEVYKAIGRAALHDTTVLILGESGTGKELVARAIHQHGLRRTRPFLAINCAALPDTLLESELFGHERGAFTGADRQRIGKFEQCDGGTLFLDEIGDMSSSTQAKALRLLQDQRFERVGGNVSVETDVRIIAATNQDLDALIASGRFRSDLYYRLNAFTIRLPPLRDRKDDIPLLANHFLRRAAADLGRPVRSLSPEALERLVEHDWPGNVREFHGAIRFAVIHASGECITADCLPESCGKTKLDAAQHAGRFDLEETTRRMLAGNDGDVYRRLSLLVDGVILEEVMRHFGGNQARAAERLGISRVTLRARLRQLGMLDG